MRLVLAFIGGFAFEGNVFGLVLHSGVIYSIVVHRLLSVLVLVCCRALKFGVVGSIPYFLVRLVDLNHSRHVVLLILG